MKKRLLIAVLIMGLMFPALVGAAELLNITTAGVDGNLVFYDVSKNAICTFDAANRKISIPSGSNITIDSGATLTVSGTLSASTTRSIPLPILGFVVQDTEASVALLTATTTTTPAHVRYGNYGPLISLGYGTTTPVSITFRVPDDYSTGGYFRLMANQSGTTTACTVDFDVYVNTAGSTMDASATDQTAATLTYAGTTPSGVTLTPATDFASLAAGQWVTLRVWRGTTTGTDALQVKNVTFVYTATR